MAKHLAPYQIYVVRCWEKQNSQPDTNVYRFMLDVPVTGQRCGFTGSRELINALELTLSQIHSEAIADTTEEKSNPD